MNFAEAETSDIYKVNLPYQFSDLPECVRINTAQMNFIEHLQEMCQESKEMKKDCEAKGMP